MQPLDRLRLRLTAWYVGTFAIILVLLGAALFTGLSGQLLGDLDRRLESAVAAVRRATDVRRAYGAVTGDALIEAVRETNTPDRLVYLFGPDGEALAGPSPVAPALHAAAAALLAGDEVELSDEFRTATGQRWRLYGEVLVSPGESPRAVVAVADATRFRAQFRHLLELFVGSALLALMPVGLGGYLIARKSTASVENAMRELRAFTADAAHELRTPVAVIRGRAELAVQRQRDVETLALALSDIAAEAERLGRLVDTLLTVASAEAGGWVARREQVFLDDVADDAVRAAQVLGNRHGVAVTIGRFEEAPVTGDRDLLHQVLMILLDNAIKYTPAGGSVRLDVFVDEHHPTVVVEDTGTGISPEHLPHVFKRFYRGEPGQSGTGGGGLGLAIARWIADRHGARIELGSAAGQGAKVVLRFHPPAA